MPSTAAASDALIHRSAPPTEQFSFLATSETMRRPAGLTCSSRPRLSSLITANLWPGTSCLRPRFSGLFALLDDYQIILRKFDGHSQKNGRIFLLLVIAGLLKKRTQRLQYPVAVHSIYLTVELSAVEIKLFQVFLTVKIFFTSPPSLSNRNIF